MAREVDLSKPLSAEDVAHLRQRHSNEYVDRLVSLAGGAEEAEDATEDTAPDEEQEDGTEGDSGAGDDDDEDDLIGDAVGNAVGATYNPADHTVEEVIRDMKSMSSEERQAVLNLEREGRQRSSILNYFAS